MEDDKEAAAVAAPPAPCPPPIPTPPQEQQLPPPYCTDAAAPRKEEPPPPPSGTQTLRFTVELRPGETTIVSWKRLLKDSGKGSGSLPNAAAADRSLSAQAGADGAPAENDLKDEVPPPNRFSAVIEKIERLYMGKQSSNEEELGDIPDDDQYDTKDSFIDDAELDEYFHVDKMSTKHNGYFVNKGKLEQTEASSSPQEKPRKKRRKDSTKMHGGGSHVILPGDRANTGNVQVKDAAMGAPAARRKLSPASVFPPYGEYQNEQHRPLKHKSKATTRGYKRKSADLITKPEDPPIVNAPYMDFLSRPLETKDFDKHKAGDFSSKNSAHKSRASNSCGSLHQAPRDKGLLEFQSKKLLNGDAEMSAKVRSKERYGSSDLAAMNLSANAYPMYAMQQASPRVKEGSSVRPKRTTLERAICDVERIVAECRPPSLDVQEVDPTFQGIKRRLPQQVKQKLAKVARLAANQGKISEDQLIDRLMGTVGHLVLRRTLKKNMREMAELGRLAKQQKADRFQQIKREANEMIRAHISQAKSKLAEQRDGPADDIQQVNNDEIRSLDGKYTLDTALEDKLCELYDLYVEGMDEDKSPQSRKFYVELTELWPSGCMDNVGIKDAIYRSKVRERALYKQHKVRSEERIKRKKLCRMRVDKPYPSAQVQSGQEKSMLISDTTNKGFVSMDDLNSYSPGSTGKSVPSPLATDSGVQLASKNHDKEFPRRFLSQHAH
ncbi:ubinuclein-1 [Canna indica]|uniref:Ubinuclein-1 n=1 Tax=Canna indica TaxID=4628 RepID=A0AAQ3L1Z0_9LILI|nr:ubinuclein-1 [Canna indica]